VAHTSNSRAILAGFFGGFVLAALLTPKPVPASSDVEIQSLQLDIARLQEQHKEDDRREQAILDWILAHDRQVVQDDIPGVQHGQQRDIDWLVWAVRGCMVGFSLLLLATVEQYLFRFRK
jgi:hypothetical protein